MDCVIDGVPSFGCIPGILGNLLTLLFGLAGVVAVILIAYGGLRFILSGGDPKQVEGARKILTYTILGLVLILLAFTILNLIAFVTGASCIKELNIGGCS